MIIEVIGLPGAGKTTVEEKLKELLCKKNVQIINRDCLAASYKRDKICESESSVFIRRVISLLYLLLLNMRWVRCSLGLLYGGGIFKKAVRIVGQWLIESIWLTKYAHSLKGSFKNEGAIFFLSEGIYHHGVSLSVWSGIPLAQFFKKLDVPQANRIVINVFAPEDIVLERFRTRGRPSSWPVCSNEEEILKSYAEKISECAMFWQESSLHVEYFQAIGTEIEMEKKVQVLADKIYDLYEREHSKSEM